MFAVYIYRNIGLYIQHVCLYLQKYRPIYTIFTEIYIYRNIGLYMLYLQKYSIYRPIYTIFTEI